MASMPAMPRAVRGRTVRRLGILLPRRRRRLHRTIHPRRHRRVAWIPVPARGGRSMLERQGRPRPHRLRMLYLRRRRRVAWIPAPARGGRWTLGPQLRLRPHRLRMLHLRRRRRVAWIPVPARGGQWTLERQLRPHRLRMLPIQISQPRGTRRLLAAPEHRPRAMRCMSPHVAPMGTWIPRARPHVQLAKRTTARLPQAGRHRARMTCGCRKWRLHRGIGWCSMVPPDGLRP